ncbi:MAG: cyclic nucleotide-binding domain-containing protein, partial [Thermodesulfobacteriota bacterium]
MLTRDSLRSMLILENLSDEMLDLLIPFIDVREYEAREVIFKEGDRSDYFYMIKSGKVLLEKRISSKITVSIASIKPGLSFGWSALLNDPLRLDAVCSEASTIYALDAKESMQLMEDNPKMGFLVYRNLIRIV